MVFVRIMQALFSDYIFTKLGLCRKAIWAEEEVNFYHFHDTARHELDLIIERREKDIYFFKDKSECDFIVKQGFDVTKAIQVTVTMERSPARLCSRLSVLPIMIFIVHNEPLFLAIV